MKRLVIVGAGGTGEDAAEIIRAANQRQPTYEMVGFLDDDPSKHGQIISSLPVHGPLGGDRHCDGDRIREKAVARSERRRGCVSRITQPAQHPAASYKILR
jgi:FlaA1/EpsC-like NDP-sugar epimerase